MPMYSPKTDHYQFYGLFRIQIDETSSLPDVYYAK